jgi:hypothetical protein
VEAHFRFVAIWDTEVDLSEAGVVRVSEVGSRHVRGRVPINRAYHLNTGIGRSSGLLRDGDPHSSSGGEH